MKQKHTKYTEINTHKSTHSEMGPVWQNPIQRTVRSAHLSVLMTSVHNTFWIHSFMNRCNIDKYNDGSMSGSVAASIFRYVLVVWASSMC